jgi:hypothetical protein
VERIETDERRAHTRYAAEIQIQGTPEDGGVVARMISSDLSVGGLSCVSSADFAEMTRLAVRLMLPLNGTSEDFSPLDVEAVVVRREEIGSSVGAKRFELALFFTQIEDEAKEQLRRFLSPPN